MLVQMRCGVGVGGGILFLRATSPHIAVEAGRMQATIGAFMTFEVGYAVHLLSNPDLMVFECAYGLGGDNGSVPHVQWNTCL